MTTPPNNEFEFNDPAQRLFVAVLFIIVFVVGTLGNALVIAAVIVSRKLRTITNAFVVNLAVADFLTSLSVPWTAVALLSGGWPLSSWICAVAGGAMYLCVGASLYSLASAAINRFILVTKDFVTYRKIFTTFNLVVWLASIWVVSFLFAIFLPLIGVGALGYNRKYHTCSQVTYHPKDWVYQLVQAVGIFPVPLAIICYCYCRIFCFVRRHAKVMSEHSSVKESARSSTGTGARENARSVPNRKCAERSVDRVVSGAQLPTVQLQQDQSVIDTSICDDHSQISHPIITNKIVSSAQQSTLVKTTNPHPPRIKSRQLKITQNMFTIVCAFVVCLAPFTICLFYNQSDPFIPYACAIVLCNSCINPCIYATKHPIFKGVMKAMVTCRLNQIPEPTGVMQRLATNKTSIIEI